MPARVRLNRFSVSRFGSTRALLTSSSRVFVRRAGEQHGFSRGAPGYQGGWPGGGSLCSGPAGQRRIPSVQTRSKKTKTVLRLEDLPQGVIRVSPELPPPSASAPHPSTPPSPPPPPWSPQSPSVPGGTPAATAASCPLSPTSPDQQPQAEAGSRDGSEIVGPAYPTVVLQARRNMQTFENCVLLTRVGGFYELYFEHAEEFGPLLNLKVAQKKTNAGPVPMAGFPFFQLDRFLKVLVQDLNRYVAIAEEFPNDASQKIKSGGLLHDRRVARIITPGTLIDENFMDPYANNYVMAIHLPEVTSESGPAIDENIVSKTKKQPRQLDAVNSPANAGREAGVAWLDLSTGNFFTQSTTLASLSSVLSRVSPREIVLDKELQSQRDHDVFGILAEDKHLITYALYGDMQTLADWAPMLEAEIPARTAASFTADEVQAGGLLLHYVKDRLRGLSMKLQPPQRHESMQVMTIDKNSMRSLEIKQTIRDGAFRGSLLHATRRTVTKGGARLLNEWLSAPSTSLEVINARLDLVSSFLHDVDLRDIVVTLLQRSHDSQRLVQKFALNRGEPDELLRLASTIEATAEIVERLQTSVDHASSRESAEQHITTTTHPFSKMISRISLEQPLKLAGRIRDAIDEEGLVQQHRLEDSETGQMIALAQEMVKKEGDGIASHLPKAVGAVASNGNGGTTAKKRPTSIREHYGEDNEIWVMKQGASPLLRRLHKDLAALLDEKVALTEALRERLNAPSLTLRWTPGLGHICHVKGRDARSAAAASSSSSSSTSEPAIKTLTSSRTTRSFHQPEWTSLGERLDKCRAQIRGEEQRVFGALRQQVVVNLVKLRRNAAVLDELDIATSFAKLAEEGRLTRPILKDTSPSSGFTPSTSTSSTTSNGNDTTPTHNNHNPVNHNSTLILGGRHPTVEGGLTLAGRTFQRNDCILGTPSHGRIWLVTGPNMAGKSTFLRQVALITILAQVGSFVPATHAELGIVDALFTRVGSADDLFRDQSTFMVEMLETAHILRSATERSFVIMDEIGRGTTPEDGTAVAFASLHHLVHVNRCRALFATHFHDVVDLAAEHGMRWEDGGEMGQVELYCTDVKEDESGGFVYIHKLRKGVNRQSHALKVARMAGLPESAIQVAQAVLSHSRAGKGEGEFT